MSRRRAPGDNSEVAAVLREAGGRAQKRKLNRSCAASLGVIERVDPAHLRSIGCDGHRVFFSPRDRLLLAETGLPRFEVCIQHDVELEPLGIGYFGQLLVHSDRCARFLRDGS